MEHEENSIKIQMLHEFLDILKNEGEMAIFTENSVYVCHQSREFKRIAGGVGRLQPDLVVPTGRNASAFILYPKGYPEIEKAVTNLFKAFESVNK